MITNINGGKMKKLFLSLLLALVFAIPAQAMVSYTYPLYSAASLGATVNSNGVHINGVGLASVQAVWTGGGSPNGTFTVEVSNDDVAKASGADEAANVTNWSTYPSSAIAITTDGDLSYNLANFGYRWVRIKYTRTSGTGTINATLVTKSESRL